MQRVVDKGEIFLCDRCDEITLATRYHDEVIAEFRERHPGVALSDKCTLVCDDCYKKIMEERRRRGLD